MTSYALGYDISGKVYYYHTSELYISLTKLATIEVSINEGPYILCIYISSRLFGIAVGIPLDRWLPARNESYIYARVRIYLSLSH